VYDQIVIRHHHVHLFLMSHYPYLAGTIKADDVRQKGSGSYAADYISWAKTMQLINEHAPGWLPEMGDLGFAPDQTAYVNVRFAHAESGKTTPWFPQSVMDNRNKPVPAEKISARDITDTHRRGICSAAACFFSLGYELWAREEILQVEAVTEPPHPVPKPAQTPQSVNPAPTPTPAVAAEVRLKLEDELVQLMTVKFSKGKRNLYLDDKQAKWGLDRGGSRIQQMNIDQLQICIDELRNRKDS
jgi:hypothetical protein